MLSRLKRGTISELRMHDVVQGLTARAVFMETRPPGGEKGRHLRLGNCKERREGQGEKRSDS